MKKIRLILAVLIWPLHLQAETFWIKSLKVPVNKFKAHIQTLSSEGDKSYAVIQLKRLRERTKAFSLEEKIKQAQKLYLSDNLLKAQESFEEITNQIYLGDWNNEERRIIFYSLLRQAQLSKQSESKKAFVKRAALFRGEEITSKDPDYSLFSPDFWKEFSQIQKKIPSTSISWKKIFPYHEIILINGKQINVQKAFYLSDGTYRITALSSSHEPWIKIISTSLLLSQSLKFSSLTKGVCEFEKIKEKWLEPHVKLFTNSFCPTSFKETALTKAASTKQYNIDIEKDLNQTKATNKYAKWIFLGSILATLGILYYFKSHPKPLIERERTAGEKELARGMFRMQRGEISAIP